MLSIGTLVAYTMVTISVLVTHYTPGVQSVLELNGTKEKTNRWLQSVCCRPEEDDVQGTVAPQVSYRELHDSEGKPSTATREPDEQTSFAARLGTFLLTLFITGLCICISNTTSYLKEGTAWAILLCCVFGLLIVACLMYITRQPRNLAVFPFMVPAVPYLPAFTVFINVFLMVNLNLWTYIRFGVWILLGEIHVNVN